MKSTLVSKSLILLMMVTIMACKSGSSDTPVDNPTMIDRAPKFETATKPAGKLSKADKVALKDNGNMELKGILTDYKGKTKHINDFQGKPKVIGFWASWCGPCIKEKPFFKQLSLKYPDIEFLSISVDEEFSLAKEYFHNRRIDIEPYDYWIGYGDENPLKWYTLRALEDGTGNAATISLPSYILIGANGKIVSNDLPTPSTGKISAYLDKL